MLIAPRCSLQRLVLNSTEKLIRTRTLEKPPIENWFDEGGQLLVVGRAAYSASVCLGLQIPAL